MNTPALLGEFYPNEQEYFLYKNSFFSLQSREFLFIASVSARHIRSKEK